MNIFKKKSLCAALAGIGALGVAGAAQAVNLNPGWSGPGPDLSVLHNA